MCNHNDIYDFSLWLRVSIVCLADGRTRLCISRSYILNPLPLLPRTALTKARMNLLGYRLLTRPFCLCLSSSSTIMRMVTRLLLLLLPPSAMMMNWLRKTRPSSPTRPLGSRAAATEQSPAASKLKHLHNSSSNSNNNSVVDHSFVIVIFISPFEHTHALTL